LAEKKLHPSVKRFKQFVKDHPHLIEQVRSGKTTWQKVYEDWTVLGEDDDFWENADYDQKGGKELKLDFLQPYLEKLKKMDVDQIQGYIGKISETLELIQGFLKSEGQPGQGEGKNRPFSFRKD
jgi:hypothetical protein